MANSEKPLVSCITTTYRKFQYLFETLDSIFIQDYPNIELIIGDDGSNNFPYDEIKQYIQDNKGKNIANVIIIHHPENHGTVYNCRSCRDVANGVYIMGIGSDDRFIDSHVVSDVVSFFEKSGAEIVTCKRRFVEAGSEKKLACMPFKNQIKWINTLDNYHLFEKMASFGFISGSNTYYTNSFYKSMRGYDTDYKYIEDYPFYLKTLRKGIKIHMFNRISILYRYGGGISTQSNIHNSYREEMYKDRIKYIEKDIIPYMSDFSWWRKQHIKVRKARFQMELDSPNESMFKKYLKLFLISPVGCVIQVWYQGSYKLKLRL